MPDPGESSSFSPEDPGRKRVFERFAAEYDRWYDDHPDLYRKERLILDPHLPRKGKGLEVGVGSGRFAAPAGILYGLEPSGPLAYRAKVRGVAVIRGLGECLPFRSSSLDYILMMTVICYLDDPVRSLQEAFRVLVPDGKIIIGFIERDGEIAEEYSHEQEKRRVLTYATFYTAGEVTKFLHTAGFTEIEKDRRRTGFTVISGRKRGI
jgi:SAM-dependent methyltransferase